MVTTGECLSISSREERLGCVMSREHCNGLIVLTIRLTVSRSAGHCDEPRRKLPAVFVSVYFHLNS